MCVCGGGGTLSPDNFCLHVLVRVCVKAFVHVCCVSLSYCKRAGTCAFANVGVQLHTRLLMCALASIWGQVYTRQGQGDGRWGTAVGLAAGQASSELYMSARTACI